MIKKKVSTHLAPQAIGPYSQAVFVGDMFYASGMIPLDPATGEIKGSTIKEQTEQVFSNIKGLLSSCMLDLSYVVKTTVFLKNMSDFTAMNEVYKTAFEGCDVLPARSAVEIGALPKGALVEIEIIAALKNE